ncbi:unnamed protein product [Staurois parvus]|uniref:Uncharacterized protein n=1 Tax=Staurois parvus TaxID=386267 RepID=A0ABN9B8R0_9NEOB|nr:unnamed protein product [Staurois parvus]CAI9612490.1 unnamed protein product [Staurois parvus]
MWVHAQKHSYILVMI